MPSKNPVFLVLFSLLLGAGCTDRRAGVEDPPVTGPGSDSGPVADSGVGADTTTPPVVGGAITITATRADEWDRLGSSLPPGQQFVLVSFGIANGTTESLPLVPALFSVRVDNGLETPASPESISIEGSCPAESSLASGRSINCRLAFQIDAAATATTLVYTQPGGASAEGAIPALAPCHRCDDRCRDLQTDTSNCGACGVRADSCEGGVPGCEAGEVWTWRGCAECDPEVHICTGTHRIQPYPVVEAVNVYIVDGPPISCASICSYLDQVCQPYRDFTIETPSAAYGDRLGPPISCETVPAAEVDGVAFSQLQCGCAVSP